MLTGTLSCSCPENLYCFLLKVYKSYHTRGGSVVGTKGPLPPTLLPSPPPVNAATVCPKRRFLTVGKNAFTLAL